MQLTWLGHSAFHLETGAQSILIDPFWTGTRPFRRVTRIASGGSTRSC